MNDYSVSSNERTRLVKLAYVARLLRYGMAKSAARFNLQEDLRIRDYQNALAQGVQQEHGFKTRGEAIDYLKSRGRWYEDESSRIADWNRLRDIASGKRGIGQIKWLKKYRPSQPLDDAQRNRIKRYSGTLVGRHMSKYDLRHMDPVMYRMTRSRLQRGYQNRNAWYHPEYVAPTSDNRFWDIANGKMNMDDAIAEGSSRWDQHTSEGVR